MSELPLGWCLASITDSGKYINGFAFKPEHWGSAGRPIIRIQNLTKSEREINRTTFVPGDEFVVRPGDILVSWSATLDAFIWDREEALVNQHIFRVIPESALVTKKYLFYLLKEAIQEMQKTEHLHGSTMKHINRGPFMAHKIPIAPRSEQNRIVDEIEKQFTRLDDAVAAPQARTSQPEALSRFCTQGRL
jgi:type I restriction enzyme S subunit